MKMESIVYDAATNIMTDVVKSNGKLTPKEIEAIKELIRICNECLTVSNAKTLIDLWKMAVEEES